MKRIGATVLPALLLLLSWLLYLRQHQAAERSAGSPSAGATVRQDGVEDDLADVAPRKPTKIRERPAASEETDGLGSGEHFGTLEYSVTTFVDGKEVSSEKIPTAQAVPGKPGFIFSPYDNRIIDATSAEPGSIFEDPGAPPDASRFIKLPGGLPPEMDSIDH